MDLRKIKKLIELLEESALTELEIREGEDSIRLSRGVQAPPFAAAPPVMIAPSAVGLPTAPAGQPAAEAQSAPAEHLAPAGHIVNSPMVGTFFASPSPGEESFVSVGASVQEGDTLCIIEAMKIFNQVEADKSGIIRAIYKESGDAVEFGEPLFVIE
ncbi:MAG: acetyl-CoA carboxylase biotin carboxyl carrier protein [Pseudomonadota bacterium]|nr:acetyl-CoA carboxylase biotin carboxyl carrier protein [Pseudomonadota bacterium]